MHISVLLNECIENLNIKEDSVIVDCTLGYGGHSSEILKRVPKGKLYSFDQDEDAIKEAREKLEKIGNNFEIIKIIIGSIHNLRDREDFYYMKSFDGINIEDMMNEYFDELLNMLQWGNFDILAHITYPFRYIFNLCGYVEDINKYSKVGYIIYNTIQHLSWFKVGYCFN